MVDNFFRNFYRQCKEPTRFGFYRVAADMADAVLPVIKDLLKDPAANAEMLAAHKVDTSEYQRQAAETLAGPRKRRRRKEKMPRRRLWNSWLRRRRKKRILTKIVYNKKQMRQWKN